MKKLLIISAWLVSSWAIWGAEPNPLTSYYREKEVSIDLFGSGSLTQDDLENIGINRIEDNGRLGAGIGVNYFHTINFGIGMDAISENTGHSLFDSASINLLGRLPLGEHGLAPYALAGIGYQFEGQANKFLQAGAGLEYRFNAKFGVFADGRYIITDGTDNHALGRLGIRICF